MDKILRYVTYIEELHFLQSLKFTHEFLQSVYDIEQMYIFPGEILVLYFFSSCNKEKNIRHDFFFSLMLRYVTYTKRYVTYRPSLSGMKSLRQEK